ncbi:unnamed protein product, partial [Ectocarpus fasciculatus]
LLQEQEAALGSSSGGGELLPASGVGGDVGGGHGRDGGLAAAAHPVAAMARDLFHPLARERRLARKAAAEQVLIPETDITNSRVRVWVVTTAW